ncbi:alkene reductase [Roseivirga thermotolerans]|uniref:alkene reductase n=1 Tax=Roseivirga thermotolerans TaxID=1758176 RepID=UPI00273EDA75|nr:alkene reductase [Roseivirga thermotolerans]
MSNLFQPYEKGALHLKNRVVMAPMTRSRAIGNMANELMAEYYAQRAEAGLIITEGASPSPNGVGYPRIPAIYNKEQASSWRQVTDAVHEKGSKIFLQIMHTGRVSHEKNLPKGGRVLAPSAIGVEAPFDKMYVDGEGMLPISEPQAMTLEEVKSTIKEYAETARLAVEAGFDGVELHGANGYLINQFLNPKSNQRTDEYGGSGENRSRLLLEVTKATIDAIGKDKVGVRISPYGVFNSMGAFEGIDAQYEFIARQLNAMGIAYLHMADMSAMTQVPVPDSIKQTLRREFSGTLILNGAYAKDSAQKDIEQGKADLIAFGVPFIANPDLVTRMKENLPLAQPDQSTFYTPGAQGYTTYAPATVNA